LSTDQNQISNTYRGPSIDAYYQVSVHLAKRFQRRLSQMNRNFVGNIYGRYSLKNANFVPIR
jgi:hypothetical protein